MFNTICKLESITRENNSANGNPNYTLFYYDEVSKLGLTLQTENDSMVAYKISDTYIGKDCQVWYYYSDFGQAFLKDINKLDEEN